MKPVTQLGEFEQVVLLAILRLEKQAYGVSIRAEIAACTGREPAPGALYTTLDRMEEKGIVRSWFGEATPGQTIFCVDQGRPCLPGKRTASLP